ncbi:MAG: hypothetical protein V1918_08795 [Planctomycetota bacterium]
MHNKLAGLLAMMAFMLLAGTWCLRILAGMSAMEPSKVLSIGIAVALLYYLVIGRMIAKLGIRLVEEELAEKRAREEEQRHRVLTRSMEAHAGESEKKAK